MEDIVQDIEIIEKLKVLKDEADLGDFPEPLGPITATFSDLSTVNSGILKRKSLLG